LTAEYYEPFVERLTKTVFDEDEDEENSDEEEKDQLVAVPSTANNTPSDIFVDPSLDVAFPKVVPLVVEPPPVVLPPRTGICANIPIKPPPAPIVVPVAKPVFDGVPIRGSREDWIARFKQFNRDFTHKEGGQMNKKAFAAVLAGSISTPVEEGESVEVEGSSKKRVDRFDIEILYFLLFGKHIHNRRAIAREFSSDDTIFHFASEDECVSSDARRLWLEEKISVIKKSTELFFSQLKASDLTLYAERFWDKVVDVMSAECLSFPFFKWEGGVRTRSIHPGSQSAVTISWELYREIVLTGMKKYLEQEVPVTSHVLQLRRETGPQQIQTHGEDIDLRGYVMHKSGATGLK
jgi:hypothetical protein